MADADYAKTSGYDADGYMTLSEANVWADNLSFTDGVNVYDNWFALVLGGLDSETELFKPLAVSLGDVGSPVPEASTGAMLLTGLGLVGTAAARRRRILVG